MPQGKLTRDETGVTGSRTVLSLLCTVSISILLGKYKRFLGPLLYSIVNRHRTQNILNYFKTLPQALDVVFQYAPYEK